MTDPTRALHALDAATARYEATKAAHEDAREDAIAKALDALRAGAMPTEVADRSPFTATYLRTLARDAGIPPAPAGMKPRAKKARKAAMKTK